MVYQSTDIGSFGSTDERHWTAGVAAPSLIGRCELEGNSVRQTVKTPLPTYYLHHYLPTLPLLR